MIEDSIPTRSLPRRLWRAWESYWFPETSTVRLASIRIIFVALQLFWFLEPLKTHLAYLQASGFVQPQIAVRDLLRFVPEAIVRTSMLITTLWWVTVAAGVFALVGLFARASMLTFALGCLWLTSFEYSYGFVHHPEAIFLIALVCIGMSPCGKSLSIDAWWQRRRGARLTELGLAAVTPNATWALRLAQWLLVIAYFESSMSKLTRGGLGWMNGYTLQNYLLMDGIRFGRPLGVWLAHYHWLCVVFSVATITFESTFFFVMLDRIAPLRRIKPLYFVGGAVFHIATFVVQAAPFWQFLALYLTWLPWEFWMTRAAAPL